MHTYLECIPCFFKQALWVAQKLNIEENEKKELIKKICKLFSRNLNLEQTPPDTARKIYDIIYEFTGITDVFKKEKQYSTQQALKFYPYLKEKVLNSKDPVLEAIRISILGNIIDFGAKQSFNLKEEVEKIDNKKFALFEYQNFRKMLDTADWVLFIGDNAGECVFDKILIETIGKKTFYAVRAKPIINDVTFEDAFKAGIEEVAEIVDSGSDLPGISLEKASRSFISLFEKAPLIISKGQGNYETLSDIRRPIFFLLQIKCPVIARKFSAAQGDFILSRNRARN